MSQDTAKPAPLVEVRNLQKHFQLPGGWLTRQRRYVHAVDEVSFSVQHGESLGLVGESGCGKTTLGRLVLRLLEPTAGEIVFDGQPIGHVRAPAPAPCAFAVRVFGDELYPAVRHGACLVVDGAGEPVVGELVLVRLHDGGHLVCEYVSGGTDHRRPVRFGPERMRSAPAAGGRG